MLKFILYFYLIQIAYGKSYFCNFACGSKHTVCKREPCLLGPKCGNGKILGMNNESRQWILDAHNKYRNELANGKDERGNNGQAANMHVLNYDKEMEFVAQCWANACTEGGAHDNCRSTKKFASVGQNMYAASSTGKTDFSSKKYIDNAVRAWYEEIVDSSSAKIDNFQSGGKTIGHFTQVIWAKTTHIGCARTIGKTNSKTSLYIYCNYGPGGNVISLPVYKRGKPCSKCGSEACSSKYPGLCGKVQEGVIDGWMPPFKQSGSAPQDTSYKILVPIIVFVLL